MGVEGLAGASSYHTDDEVFTFDRKSLLSILSLIPNGLLIPEVPPPSSFLLKAQSTVQKERGSEPAVTTWQAAKVLYRMRRERDNVIGQQIFSDPAWDILLDLYAAEGEGQRICISSACIAASVPYSTALRCLRELESRALIRRVRDRQDGRRIYVELTADCRSSMLKILGELRCQIPAA